MTQSAPSSPHASGQAANPPHTARTLIDDLLDEQQRLTAVERFARRQEAGLPPAQMRYYRDLLPTGRPQAGQQYAFAVDLDACTGCKACVSACHSLNGLDEDEIWRTVGVLYGGDSATPYQQTITTACHHCVEPGCLEGCPVMAYDKDAETGIVRHLDDQCIGCQYCILKCPYDVPKYSAKRGIVRKCDMCSNRLAAGEAPACVQACPTKAIRIDVIDSGALLRNLRPGESLVPGAFDSTYTKPTTRYRTARRMPGDARAGDSHALRLEHAHWPLIVMLLLSQMSVGLLLVLALLSFGDAPAVDAALGAGGFAVLQAGLAVSVLHLGRPLGAWRFFLGLRTSWMSREILAFGGLAAVVAACAACAAVGLLGPRWGVPFHSELGKWTSPLAWVATLVGFGAIYCSAMIYIDTRRAYWRSATTLPRFFGSTLLLGTTASACLLGWTAVAFDPSAMSAAAGCTIAAGLLRVALFAWEEAGFRSTLRDPRHIDHRSALTIWTLRRPLAIARLPLFMASTGFAILSLSLGEMPAAIAATLALVTTSASQLIERYFYFTAVIAPRMPGGVAA